MTTINDIDWVLFLANHALTLTVLVTLTYTIIRLLRLEREMNARTAWLRHEVWNKVDKRDMFPPQTFEETGTNVDIEEDKDNE